MRLPLVVTLAVTAALAAALAQAQPQPPWIAPARSAEEIAAVPPAAAPDGGVPRKGASTPFWIWPVTSDNLTPTEDFARAGTVWLARSFSLPEGAKARSARLALAADNHAIAFLNGAEVLRSDSWSSVGFADVTLKPGENILAIEAVNDAGVGTNPAGVAARLIITLDDGSSSSIFTDGAWRGSDVKWLGFPAAAPGRGEGKPAVAVGRSTSAPWRLAPDAFEPPPPVRPCPMLRRVFTLDAAPAPGTTAPVRIVGLGHYELRCNGRIVGDTLINQSWSQYNKTLYSQEFDLAPHLRAGENVLAVSLGNSFWSVQRTNDPGRFSKTDAMPDFAAQLGTREHLLWLEAVITDGKRKIIIGSDGAWKCADSPLTFSHIYGGEDFDARLIQAGWDGGGAAAIDDSRWKPVDVVPAPAAQVVPLPGPAMKAFEVFQPESIKHPGPDAFTYIFPQNCSALLRFTLTGGQSGGGSKVRFKPCEYVDDTGRVKFTYTWNTGKDIWFDYTKSGSGEESHQTLFCYVGAQFVQVEGAVPEGRANPDNLPVLRSLELVHVRADCAGSGTFTCSSDLHTSAHRIIDWAIRSNMAHFPTDCPHREKNSWIEQDWHMARSMCYTYDANTWLAKTCHDIRDTQLPDGHIPTNSPNYLVGVPPHGFWNEAAEWGIAGVLVPWHLYEWYGDRRILEESYDSARRYIDYLASTAKDGAITSNLGDWYDFGHGKGNGPSRWTPNEVSATIVWAIGTDTLVRMAEVLGHTDDAVKYRAMHTQIRADFQRRFYDPEAHTVKHNGSCQAGTAAALYANLIPGPDRAAALEAIIDDLKNRSFQQTPGEVLQIFLIRVLAESGRGDILHRIYNREDVGSYGHMVKSGLTTLPESWDARRGTGDSLNHFMLGHLMEWHYAYVAGIRQQPGSIGWKKILIAPQPPPPSDASPNAIQSAEANFNSPVGPIASKWSIKDGVFSMTCSIPTGVEAVAILSDGTRWELKSGTNVLACLWR